MKPATIDELRTLEAHIEAGAVGGNPTWLLFLVIWLQATIGIDFDDINRSQPVELLDGWIRFVYRPGRTKRMANRVSYYWGAPSRTTSGYCWAQEFLAWYHRRGKSTDEGMPRTTFGTCTADSISGEEAREYASNVVANEHQDYFITPEATNTHEPLPTLRLPECDEPTSRRQPSWWASAGLHQPVCTSPPLLMTARRFPRYYYSERHNRQCGVYIERLAGRAWTPHVEDPPPLGDDAIAASFLSLCGSQYSHLSLHVAKELLEDAVQTVAFNAWVNFTKRDDNRVIPNWHCIGPSGNKPVAEAEPHDEKTERDAQGWERQPPIQHTRHEDANSYYRMGPPPSSQAQKACSLLEARRKLGARLLGAGVISSPFWWRQPMAAWPPLICEWPVHPLRGMYGSPSGWICRCGLYDLDWQHRARPYVDTVCRDCHTLMAREGILWDDWCRSTREGLPWSPSVRPDSPWPTGAIPLPMLSNSNTGGYSYQDVANDKSLLTNDHVAARNAARHAAGRGSEAEHSLETLAKIDPQEANPEDADLQAQHTPVQAGQGAEETDDFASEQPTSHSGRNDTEKSAHLHLSPLPVYTPPIISTGLHGGMSASSLSAGCKLGG